MIQVNIKKHDWQRCFESALGRKIDWFAHAVHLIVRGY